jgi:hypothetical protein
MGIADHDRTYVYSGSRMILGAVILSSYTEVFGDKRLWVGSSKSHSLFL